MKRFGALVLALLLVMCGVAQADFYGRKQLLKSAASGADTLTFATPDTAASGYISYRNAPDAVVYYCAKACSIMTFWVNGTTDSTGTLRAGTTDPDSIMPCGILAYPVDLAIATDHMTLAAIDLGLGTCWIGAFAQDEVKRILKIPEKLKVVSLLTLGYPDEPGRPKMRKTLKEIICYEIYSD